MEIEIEKILIMLSAYFITKATRRPPQAPVKTIETEKIEYLQLNEIKQKKLLMIRIEETLVSNFPNIPNNSNQSKENAIHRQLEVSFPNSNLFKR